MVEGYFDVARSSVLSPEQKEILFTKLRSRINSEGLFYVRSQVHRSQLANKAEVITKMNELVRLSLKKEKKRIATKPSAASKARRLEYKKKTSEQKQQRKRIRFNDY